MSATKTLLDFDEMGRGMGHSGAAKERRGADLFVSPGIAGCQNQCQRKVHRVSHSTIRHVGKAIDVGDAAAIIRLMKKPGEAPISFKYLCSLNFNGFDLPPTYEALEKISKCYIDKYGEVGIAEMIWDEEANKWKYKDVDGSWAWC